MGCGWTDIVCEAKEVIKSVADSAVGALAHAIGDAVASVLESLNDLWLHVPGPQIEQSGGGGAGPAVAAIEGNIYWITMAIAVGCTLAAGTKMALDRKGESLQVLLKGLGRLVFVAAAGPYAVQLANDASQKIANDLMGSAHLGDGVKDSMGALAESDPGVIIIFGILVLISSLIQVMIMIVRGGLLIILVGTLPLAASASMTGWGGDWWKKHTGWLIAWLVYKPAAALVIFSATAMTGSQNNFVTKITGMAMLVLAVFTLPAMLKLVVPATSAMGGASGGGMAMAAGAAIATGAVTLAAAGATGGASLGASGAAGGMKSATGAMGGAGGGSQQPPTPPANPVGSQGGGGNDGGSGLSNVVNSGSKGKGEGDGDDGGNGPPAGALKTAAGGDGTTPQGGQTSGNTSTTSGAAPAAGAAQSPAAAQNTANVGSGNTGRPATTPAEVMLNTVQAAGGAAKGAMGDNDQV